MCVCGCGRGRGHGLIAAATAISVCLFPAIATPGVFSTELLLMLKLPF